MCQTLQPHQHHHVTKIILTHLNPQHFQHQRSCATFRCSGLEADQRHSGSSCEISSANFQNSRVKVSRSPDGPVEFFDQKKT